MHLDITQARTYFLKKSNWKKLWFIFVLIGLLGLIPWVGSLIETLIFTSYAFFLTNLRIFKPNQLPPDFNFNDITPIMGKVFGFMIISSLIFAPLIMLLVHQITFGKSVPLICIAFILIVLFSAYLHVAGLVFATNLKFSSFFKWKAIKYVLVDRFSDYVSFGITFSLAVLAFFVILLLSAITIVGPLLLAPFAMFIFSDLNAQFVRQVFKINAK